MTRPARIPTVVAELVDLALGLAKRASPTAPGSRVTSVPATRHAKALLQQPIANTRPGTARNRPDPDRWGPLYDDRWTLRASLSGPRPRRGRTGVARKHLHFVGSCPADGRHSPIRSWETGCVSHVGASVANTKRHCLSDVEDRRQVPLRKSGLRRGQHRARAEPARANVRHGQDVLTGLSGGRPNWRHRQDEP